MSKKKAAWWPLSPGVTPNLHLIGDCRDRARARGVALGEERRERIAGYTFPFFSEAVFYHFKPGVISVTKVNDKRLRFGVAPWSPFGEAGRAIPLRLFIPPVSEARLTKAIDLLFPPNTGKSLLAAIQEGYEFVRQNRKKFPSKGRRLRIPAEMYGKWFEAILFPEDLCDWPEEEHVRPSDADIFAITVSNFKSMGIEVDEEGVKKAFARWKETLS